MMRTIPMILAVAALPVSAMAQTPATGTQPVLPEPERGLLPQMVIPRPAGDRKSVV